MSGFGIDFKNNVGAKVLDGSHIVPQFFQKRSMLDPYYAANYPPGYVEFGEADGAQPGYIIRSYYGGESPTSRPHITFVQAPTDGSDVWVGAGVYTIIFAVGNNPGHPDLYTFTLDYVDRSTSGYGMRAFKSDGTTLVYDSGNRHLNIHAIMDNVTVDDNPGSRYTQVPVGGTRSFSIPSGRAFPYKPGILLPTVTAGQNYHTRFDYTYNWSAYSFYRIYGGQLQTRMFRYDFEQTGWEDDSGSSYSQIYPKPYNGGTKVGTMVIDCSIYD